MKDTDKLKDEVKQTGEELPPKQGEHHSEDKVADYVCECGCPIYDKTFTLKDTAKLMVSKNYKERFVAEYVQLKIRYEKLKYLLTKWEAFEYIPHPEVRSEKDWKEAIERWLGFTPSCSKDLLREQQDLMGRLLHVLELRAVIEEIDLKSVTIKL